MFPTFKRACFSNSKWVGRLSLWSCDCAPIMKQAEKKMLTCYLRFTQPVFPFLTTLLLRESGFLDFSKKMVIAFQTLKISLFNVYSLLNLFVSFGPNLYKCVIYMMQTLLSLRKSLSALSIIGMWKKKMDVDKTKN